MPGDRARDIADRVRPCLAERRIGAEELSDAAERNAGRDPGDGKPGEGGERRPRAAERRPRALADGEQAEREHDDRDESDRLQARGEREPDRSEQERLPRQRRIPKTAGQRPHRERRDRVVQRLAHQQPAVHEPGNEHRETARDERPAWPCERPGPEEDGDRRRRHQQRLEQLHAGHAGCEVAAEEREADQQRVQKAVVRDGRAEHAEAVARDERAAEQAVQRLVRRDPRRSDVAREREADDRRRQHESGEDEDRAIDSEASPHGGQRASGGGCTSRERSLRRRERRLHWAPTL